MQTRTVSQLILLIVRSHWSPHGTLQERVPGRLNPWKLLLWCNKNESLPFSPLHVHILSKSCSVMAWRLLSAGFCHLEDLNGDLVTGTGWTLIFVLIEKLFIYSEVRQTERLAASYTRDWLTGAFCCLPRLHGSSILHRNGCVERKRS
jgi:hypothetical protein